MFLPHAVSISHAKYFATFMPERIRNNHKSRVITLLLTNAFVISKINFKPLCNLLILICNLTKSEYRLHVRKGKHSGFRIHAVQYTWHLSEYCLLLEGNTVQKNPQQMLVFCMFGGLQCCVVCSCSSVPLITSMST